MTQPGDATAWPDLEPMFEPRTIALIGFRPDNRYCTNVLGNARALGIEPERVVVVDRTTALEHPERMVLPPDTDLAYLLTGAWSVPGLLREVSSRGVRAGVVLAGGFGEDVGDGDRNQAALLEASEKMVICGTSTMGLVNVPSRVGLFGAPLPDLRAGGCSLILQSGGYANVMLNIASQRLLGLDKVVVTGTEARVSLADYLDYFVRAGTSRVIGVHCESVSDGSRFRAALRRAHEAGVQVVLLLSGQSERSVDTVASHSGNLAAGRIWRDVAEGYGAIVVDNVDELTETLVLLSGVRPLVGGGVQLVTVSGGDCSLMTDIAASLDVDLPRPEPAIKQRLAELLPGRNIVGNPMDVGGLIRPKPEVFRGVLEALCENPATEVVGYRLNIPNVFDEQVADGYRTGFAIAARAGKVPLVFTRASEIVPTVWAQWFADEGVPLTKEITKTLQAIRRAQLRAGRRPPDAAGTHPPITLPDATTLGLLDLAEVLGAAGIDVAAPIVVDSADRAVEAQAAAGGPVVLKIESPELPHKSDHGAVLTGLAGAESVRAGYERLHRLTAELGLTGAAICLQPQIAGGVEMLAGVVNDPHAGPVVTVGTGGIFTEVFRDTVSWPAPVDESQALAMISRLRSYPILRGARGRGGADVPALARAVSALSAVAVAVYGQLSHIDLNPIMVLPDGRGAVAVDALAIPTTKD